MDKTGAKLKLKKIIAFILTVIIIFSTASSTIKVFAAEEILEQSENNTDKVIVKSNEQLSNEQLSDEKIDTQITSQENTNESSLVNESIGEISENITEEETLDSSEDISKLEDSLEINESEKKLNKSIKSKAPLNTSSQSSVEEAFKINLRWSGTTSETYTWNAQEREDRVIKLVFNYQNEVTSTSYNVGDLRVTIPGIGKLNRDKCLEAADVAADEYGAQVLTRDWSYTYNESNDTYTFYNNNEIESGSSFSGSFELLWEFDSRECKNGYEQKLQATLDYGQKSILSRELTLEFTSKKDTFYINKTATGIASGDGLSGFVEDGKTVSDYAWVKYTFTYNVQTLNSRGLKNRTIIDTFPSGCVVADDSNVTKNADGTVSYNKEEMAFDDNRVIERSIIVGYPSEYLDTTIKNTVYLNGTYKDENEEELLATGEVEVKLINLGFQWNGYVIKTEKNMNPEYIYKEDLQKYVDFGAKLSVSTTVKPEDQAEYDIAITDDLVEIVTDDYHRLNDDEYHFTDLIVPGKNKFYNANGYNLADGNYTVTIKVLYKDNVNTRNLDEYTTIYEGNWENSDLYKALRGDVVAVRVEIGGLTESITDFYITLSGIIDVAESGYENPSYIVNYSFTDFYAKSGNFLMSDITEDNYTQKRLFYQDTEIYGRGLQRAVDTIEIRDSNPGEYYARTEIDDFKVDKEIENFSTTQKHSIEVVNNNASEIKKIKLYGVNTKEDLKTLIETLEITYSGLEFKYMLSDDTDITDYLRERANIEKNNNVIKIEFDFSDNPIVAKEFTIGYKVDSQVSYEDYYEENDPYYSVRTYAYIENTNIEPQTALNYDGKRMAHEIDSANILLALASHQQLIKLVKTQYTNGEFVEDGAVVPLNTEYTYRLKLRNGYNTLEGTEFVDILEHSELTAVNGEYPYNESEWYGKLKSVDTKYVESKGNTVRVYYANTITPDENSWTLMETHSDGIWQTVNEVQAIKVEIDGEITENSIIHVDVNMQAPTDETKVDKYTYNTYTISADAIDIYAGLRSSYMRNMPSNVTEVRLTKKEYNLEIVKVDQETGSKLQGVVFGIYNEEGIKINTNVTGILGDTKVEELKEGTYTIKEEVVPLGYERPEDYTLIIDNGNYTLKQNDSVIAEGEASLDGTIPCINITIENKRAKGSITVHKIDEYLDENKQEVPIEGIEFELQDTDGNVIDTGTTNENGEILFDNLAWGKTYVIKEKQALQGYEQAIENTYLSKLIKDKTVTVENIRKTGKAILTKEDKVNGTKVEGATYGLYARNDIYNKNGEIAYEKDRLIDYKTTNENGQAIFDNLIWGDYYIKERSTVYGYELSEEEYTFTINAQNVEETVQKTEKEVRSKAKLQLLKMDDTSSFLSDAEFALFNSNDEKIQDGIITGDSGIIEVENIDWGNYYIQEINAPQGYELNNTKYNFTVDRDTFTVDGIVTIVVNSETNEETTIIRNNRKKGKVVLTKYKCNEEGEETTEILEGAVFDLYLSDGTKIGEYTSNEEGKITVENLVWGSYYFQETTAPEGYSVSSKKIPFVINRKNVDFEQELSAYNKLQTAEIKINKKIKASTLLEAHGNASFVFKIVGKDQENVEKFTLYRTVTFSSADEEIADLDGNITKTIVISDLERYNYEITEEENYRYELDSIIPVTSNAEVNGETGIVDLVTENEGEITFVNEKTNNSLLTHSMLITNATQSGYYLIGIGATPKQDEYIVGTELTASDFTFTLYYSGGQEVETDLSDGITFDGESTYTEGLPGDYITNIEYTLNGKTFAANAITTWIRPYNYFITEVIDEEQKTMRILGVNENYEAPTVLYIPSEYNGYKVVELGSTAVESATIQNISNVSRIVMQEGIENIGNYAFSGSDSGITLEIPNSLKIIGNHAFDGSIICIISPEQDTGPGWFGDIILPNGVTSIGDYAFYQTAFPSFIIPGTVTSIGKYAFSSMTSIIPLGNIEILEGVTSIGEYSFANVRRIVRISIPKSVTKIEDNAFYGVGSISYISYSGTEEEFNNIEVGSGNTAFTNSRVVYSSEE